MLTRDILMGVTPRTEKALFAPLMGAEGAFSFGSSGFCVSNRSAPSPSSEGEGAYSMLARAGEGEAPLAAIWRNTSALFTGASQTRVS